MNSDMKHVGLFQTGIFSMYSTKFRKTKKDNLIEVTLLIGSDHLQPKITDAPRN